MHDIEYAEIELNCGVGLVGEPLICAVNWANNSLQREYSQKKWEPHRKYAGVQSFRRDVFTYR